MATDTGCGTNHDILARIERKVDLILSKLCQPPPDPITGVLAIPGTPSTHLKGQSEMAQVTWKLIKASALKKLTAPKAAGPLTGFGIVDNGDQPYTMVGTDAAGNHIDLSAIASLTPAPTSDNVAVVTVDPPVGMSFTAHAATPAPAVGATANINGTVTITDGRSGPFGFTLPETIQAGPVSGVIPVPGVPTSH